MRQNRSCWLPCLFFLLLACLGGLVVVNGVVWGAWWVVENMPDTPISVANQEEGEAGRELDKEGDGETVAGLRPVPTLMPTAVVLLPTTPPSDTIPTLPQQHDLPLIPNLNLEQRPIPADGAEMLARLVALAHPPHDYYEVEQRLGQNKNRARTLSFVAPHELGDQRSFITVNGVMTATLAAVGENAYFWLEEGLPYDEGELTAVVNRFDNELYPSTSRLFGNEWNPGMDGDPRFHILHLTQFESDELGYFDSTDAYPQSMFGDSNEGEIIYLNLGEMDLGEELYYGTLVHELQHLTQWNLDPNESTWLDEGLAQLAEHLAGFDSFDVQDYLASPATPLTQWGEADVYAHYAASALFAIYFYEQLGEPAVYELVRHPNNGLNSVAAVLARFQPERSLNQFMADWAVANFVADSGWGEAYGYNYGFSLPTHDWRITAVPYSESQTLPQYGVRYLELPAGNYQLSFAGDTLTELADAPVEGRLFWYTTAVDNAATHLTRRLDLRQTNTATLTFDTWYELEEEYDFAYLLVSPNGGEKWQVLDLGEAGQLGPHGTGLNGQSDGWETHSVSLDRWTGQEVLLRFWLLTDGGITERGWGVDNIAVPEIGFLDTVEAGGDGLWLTEGFAPVGHVIPQNWSVQVLVYDDENEGTNTVLPLPLDGRNQGQWDITLPQGGTLILMPQNPITTQPVRYWLNLE